MRACGPTLTLPPAIRALRATDPSSATWPPAAYRSCAALESMRSVPPTATRSPATGPLSDRTGRKPLIVWGMVLQAAALAALGLRGGVALWTASMVALGLGTAMVYPTLLGAVSDHAQPGFRASAIGVYRLWRDLGYAIGAVLAGAAADLLGIGFSIQVVAALTLVSGT